MNYRSKITEALNIITASPKPDGAALVGALRELDAVVKEAGDQLPGDLKHYLERRSYEKAARWMEGQADIKRGTCGGRESVSG